MSLEIVNVSYELNRENPSGTVIYRADWTGAGSYATELVGGMIGGYYCPPANFPIGALSGLRCNKAAVKKWGTGTWSGQGGYLDAEITASFGILKQIDQAAAQGAEGISLAEFSATVSGESITIPNTQVQWATGSKVGQPLSADDVQTSMLIPFTELSLKMKYCTSDGLGSITACSGLLNGGGMQITPSCYANSECLIFLGGNVSATQTPQGYSQWERDLKFGLKQQSWNRLWCPSTSTWELVSPPPFTDGDFSALFSTT